jgi:anti-sigma-K factor RskA
MSGREDIPAYLLGELDERERAAFEHAAARDESLRAEVERLRPVIQRLHELDNGAWAPEPAPPVQLPAAGATGRERRTLRLRPAFAVLAAAALLGAGVAIGLLAGGGEEGATGGRQLALAPVGSAARSAQGEARLHGSSATVDVSGLQPSGRGRFYELWLLNSPDDLVSLASFRVPASGKARVTVPLPDGGRGYRFVDLSVEPKDGNPAHSGDSVLRGRVPGA